MRKKWLIFLTISLISNICSASDLNVEFLPKGEFADYDGYLFTPDATLKAYQAEKEVPQYKLLNDSLQTSLNLETNNFNQEQKEKQLLLNENLNLRNTIEKQKDMSNLERALYFIAGVVVTSLAIDGASKLIK